jgi:hypothetical protein
MGNIECSRFPPRRTEDDIGFFYMAVEKRQFANLVRSDPSCFKIFLFLGRRTGSIQQRLDGFGRPPDDVNQFLLVGLKRGGRRPGHHLERHKDHPEMHTEIMVS